MRSFAIAVVWFGRSFSSPGIGTGCKAPISSICGGRPGEKMRSLTLSETDNMRCRTPTKFICGAGVGGGAAPACVSVLIE
jgi:hypothetical protein